MLGRDEILVWLNSHRLRFMFTLLRNECPAKCSIGTAKCIKTIAKCSIGTAKCSKTTAKCSIGTAKCSIGTAKCSTTKFRCTHIWM